jgi:hypothetical protein
MRPRLYPDAEYQKTIGEPLPVAKLARIWHGLPEQDRLGFVLSLDEHIADKVIEATALAQTSKEPHQ